MLDIKEIERRLENGEEVMLECIDEDKYLNLEENWQDSRQIILDSSLVVTGLYGDSKNNLEIRGASRIIPDLHFDHFKIKEKQYTEKLLDRDSKFTELLSVATKAVNNGDLSSFVVNVADSSDKIGECLYIGANMTYHAIENEIKGLEMKEELEVKEEIETSDFDTVVDSAFKALKDGVIKEIGLNNDILMIQEIADSERSCITERERMRITRSEVAQNGACAYLYYINSLYTKTFVIKDFHDTKALKKGDKAVLGNGEEVIFTNRTGVNNELWFEYDDCRRKTVIPFVALKGATVTQQKGNK